jgi:hypothetical protein
VPSATIRAEQASAKGPSRAPPLALYIFGHPALEIRELGAGDFGMRIGKVGGTARVTASAVRSLSEYAAKT